MKCIRRIWRGSTQDSESYETWQVGPLTAPPKRKYGTFPISCVFFIYLFPVIRKRPANDEKVPSVFRDIASRVGYVSATRLVDKSYEKSCVKKDARLLGAHLCGARDLWSGVHWKVDGSGNRLHLLLERDIYRPFLGPRYDGRWFGFLLNLLVDVFFFCELLPIYSKCPLNDWTGFGACTHEYFYGLQLASLVTYCSKMCSILVFLE